jgi:hypothetical protein
MNHHDHAQSAVVEAQHRSKEDIQAIFGTVVQLRQKLAAVLEMDAQQDRDAEEDELWVRDRIEYVVLSVL